MSRALLPDIRREFEQGGVSVAHLDDTKLVEAMKVLAGGMPRHYSLSDAIRAVCALGRDLDRTPTATG